MQCQTNLTKVMNEKENFISQNGQIRPLTTVSQHNVTSSSALSDTSNKKHSVSFASPSLKRQPITPRPSFPFQNYPSPYAYGHHAYSHHYAQQYAMNAPPMNHSPYHAYGIGMNGNKPQIFPNSFSYPHNFAPVNQPMQQPFHPGHMQSPSATREYSKIMRDAKSPNRKK